VVSLVNSTPLKKHLLHAWKVLAIDINGSKVLLEFWVWFITFLVICSLFVLAFDDYSWKNRIKFCLSISFLLAILIASATNS
jgi:cell division protein FtsW (lipid II flippase)